MRADKTTVTTEMKRLLRKASRPDGVEKNRTYGSSDRWPWGKKLFRNVNTFGYRMPIMSTRKMMTGIIGME